MSSQVRVNLYRVSGRGRDALADAIVEASENAIQFDTHGNTYEIAECESGMSGLVWGRFRRLQERDVPPIGNRQGVERSLEEGEGLSHRAFFLFDPSHLVLFWLSSYHSCGPAWLKHIVAKVGCRISLAIYLDESTFRQAKASRKSMTSISVAVATDAGADIGEPITDELIEKAENMEADVVELVLKVRHQKADQKSLNSAWSMVEALFNARERTPGAVRRLKVESFDAQTGEFIARDLLRGRQYVDLGKV